MTDVEGVEMRHVLNVFAHVAVVQAVPGIDPQAELVGMSRRASVAGQLLAARRTGGRVGVTASVKFHGLRADAMGRVDLSELGVDERADFDFGGIELGDDALEPLDIGGYISPPSVVISSRLSGTRQTSSGLNLSACLVIPAVAAISRLRGIEMARERRRTSVSWIWRRSSRRWTVMAWAPACSAMRAASRTLGSGGSPAFHARNGLRAG